MDTIENLLAKMKPSKEFGVFRSIVTLMASHIRIEQLRDLHKCIRRQVTLEFSGMMPMLHII